MYSLMVVVLTVTGQTVVIVVSCVSGMKTIAATGMNTVSVPPESVEHPDVRVADDHESTKMQILSSYTDVHPNDRPVSVRRRRNR